MAQEANDQEPPTAYALTLGDYLAVLWRRKLIIIALVALCVALAVAYTVSQTPLYRSSASVQLRAITSRPFEPVRPELQLSMANEKTAAAAPDVATRASTRLPDKPDPNKLLRHLDVNNPVDTNILVFRYTSQRAGQARLRAQAFATSYLEMRRDEAGRIRDQMTADLHKKADDLAARIRDAAARSAALASTSPERLAADSARSTLVSQQTNSRSPVA
jgi:uncharacterized protein involved in exopolysaccharide biosynthesis